MNRHFASYHRRPDVLNIVEVGKLTGLSAAEINRRIAEKTFPIPTMGIAAVPMWHASEIELFLGTRWLARC
jgi:predicted DNA-binding transcriptional regulator AlpA